MFTKTMTSECVTIGHPDKVCDQISDAILDACLEKDEGAHVAVETLATGNKVHIAGEVSGMGTGLIDAEGIARSVIKRIGYDSDELGFNGDTCEVTVDIHQQSPDIAGGVAESLETRKEQRKQMMGAGDQGMMYGYAENCGLGEKIQYMPPAMMFARDITSWLAYQRQNHQLDWLRPDGKAQVTVEYSGNLLIGVKTVVVSTQHDENVGQKEIEEGVMEMVLHPLFNNWGIKKPESILINPSGRFVLGGPAADTGLTGRKIIVDTYGGSAPHGGGAFSGKDWTKVDRSGAYMARLMAKTVVAAGVADRCMVRLAYAIGKAFPVEVYVETFGTSKFTDREISETLAGMFNLTPEGIAKRLKLDHQRVNLWSYLELAAWGHFGVDDGREWESCEAVGRLRDLLRLQWGV